MRTRKSKVEIFYNGKAISTSLDNCLESFEYVDNANGVGDTISITIDDSKNYWKTAWMPQKGDTLRAIIKIFDWDFENDNRILDCGEFLLDEFSFSAVPQILNISAISTPLNESFKSTARTKTWENISIMQIANEIATRANIKLFFDAPTIKISSIEQNEQTDCEFLSNLCETYGLCMKIYSNKLVIFNREQYKTNKPIAILTQNNIINWSWKTSLYGTYTGGQISYINPDTEEEIIYKTGNGLRILNLTCKADSLADAQLKLNAAISNANHNSTTLSINLIGNTKFYAGQTITVANLGKLSGKYFIDSVSHSIANGYTINLELSLIEFTEDTVIKEAIERLNNLGIIKTPLYWKNHYTDILYLDELLINLASRIKNNLISKKNLNLQQAISILEENGIINSSEYWIKNSHTINFLPQLIINAANTFSGEEDG